MENTVFIKNLSFQYRNSRKKALNNISGHMGKGEFVAVMGHGGAGKSTICCALNGLVPNFYRGDYSGTVKVMNRDVAGSCTSDMSRLVGLVLQDFETQLFSTNVELEVAFGPENFGLDRTEIGRRIEKYLGFVGMEHMRNHDSVNISGGEKQRLAIASVLAMETPILVMDEPVTDLDPLGRRHILELSGHLREHTMTLVIADSEPENIVKADNIWLIRDGEIIAMGVPGKILTDVPLLESCGVMALPTIAFFHAMAWPGNPLTGDEAIALIKKMGLAAPGQKRSFNKQRLSESNTPVLEAKDLSFQYQKKCRHVLRNINFSINQGEFVAILGQNGSGKTTLAKHFNGLLKPTSGAMLVKGKTTKTTGRHDLARTVGYVFQNPDHQIFANTVYEEVGFGLKVLGEKRNAIDKRIGEALSVTGLTGYEDKSPFLLTRGERQRVALASVLAVKPEVIILDEPSTGLDYTLQRETMEMLKHMNLQGHTVIIITHAMWIAESYATRTMLMREGLLIADGSTRSVFADEGILAEASLAPSPLVQISNYLGAEALTVEKLVQEIKS